MKAVLKFAGIICIVACNYAYSQVSNFASVDFTRADSVAALYPKTSLGDLNLLSKRLTSPFQSEVEKFRAIFTWVCSNVTNDYYLYAINKEKREKLSGEELKAWNSAFKQVVFDKLFRTQGTVCTGYAYLIRELALRAGLSCEIINGYGRNVVSNLGGEGIPNHSWNAIELDDRWFLCDATWASGSIDPQQKHFVQQYNDVYFLTDPEFFILNHYPLEAKWTLIDKNPSLTEFLNSPIAYVAAIRERITDIEPHSFQLSLNKGDSLHVTVQGRIGMSSELSLWIGNSRTSRAMSSIPVSVNESRYRLSHRFRFKGKYAVHILLNDEHLYSYQVLVK